MEIGKICIVVPFWRRPNVSTIFWENIRLQQKHLDLEVVAVVSEPFNECIARNYTPHIVRHNNMPLGKKWNEGVKYSKRIDYTHLMILGSDDIFHHHLISLYRGMTSEYVGLMDATALNLRNLQGRFFKGYSVKSGREGESVGSGRLISKGLVERMNFELFGPVNKGVDISMTKKLKAIGVENQLVRTGFTYDRIGLKTESTVSGLFGTWDRRMRRDEMSEKYSSQIAKMIFEYYG